MAVENKAKSEQVHIKGRNHFDVVSQIVEKYNASEGWAVKKVIPNVVTIEVILERSTEQGVADADNKKDKAATTPKNETPKEGASTTETEVDTKKSKAVKSTSKSGTTPPKESKEEVKLTETTKKK